MSKRRYQSITFPERKLNSEQQKLEDKHKPKTDPFSMNYYQKAIYNAMFADIDFNQTERKASSRAEYYQRAESHYERYFSVFARQRYRHFHHVQINVCPMCGVFCECINVEPVQVEVMEPEIKRLTYEQTKEETNQNLSQ